MVNRIENVSIDNSNQAFGGFVYAINYTIGLGGESSRIRVTIINETGDYFVDENDLKCYGSPTEIKIGSNITFYGYPITATKESGSGGKILTVEFIEESIAYLDRRVVALSGRIEEPVPDGVVLVGNPFVSKYALGANLQFQLSSENSQYLTLDDDLKIPDILYTFPELLEKINDIIGTRPVLTDNHDNFYRNYVGTLREVLSSWCNDLGLTFYWQDRKLNFIDLRNPATFEVIRSTVDTIFSDAKAESVEETITLQDTFSRAHTSLYLRNGSVGQEVSQIFPTVYRFSCLKLDDIHGVKSYYGIGFSGSLLQSPYIDWIKGAKFGPEIVILYLLSNAITTSYVQFPKNDPCIAIRKLASSGDSTAYNFLKQEADTFYGSNGIYNIYVVYERTDGNGKVVIPESFQSSFQKYAALASVMGRFFYTAMGKTEAAEQFEKNDNVHWYSDLTPFKETIIGEALKDLSTVIPNYDTITIKGFLLNNNSYNINNFSFDGAGNVIGANFGYAICEAVPKWLPNSFADIFTKEHIFRYDPTSNSTNLDSKAFYIVLPTFTSINLSAIIPPNESGINVYGIPRTKTIGPYIDPKIQDVKTSYPEIFSTAQVSRLDVRTIDIPEELIIAQGPLLGGISNLYNPANFVAAHNAYTLPIAFSQDKPFFSKTFTLPYIDIGVTPKIEEGFQSLNISYGSNGLTATYTYGTNLMKIPEPGFYVSAFYDARQKKLLPYLKPSIIVNGGGAYKIN